MNTGILVIVSKRVWLRLHTTDDALSLIITQKSTPTRS